MAAPSGTIWGSVVGGYGRIGIYPKVTITATSVDIDVEIWFWSKYSVSDTGNTLYYDNLASSGSATTSRGAVSISTTVDTGSGWSTSNQKKLKTYTPGAYSRGTSASTRYLYAKLTNIDRVGGTMTVSTTVSIPKLASYTVSYNANGGSGAPSSQTKWYGKTLTLSSTKPTRSGYTFQGWGTSASDTTVDYSAGGSYTTNAGDTLYAIWKKTITLTYNANGGSGAPGSQSATVYNATTSNKFTLSSTKPTRTGYTFLGWSTSSSATSASYSAGGSVTLSSSDTLYAIWKIITYTVSYKANGGSNAPSAQTKTYGKTLTLSSAKPTRTGYTFQGWGTSASDTSVDYAAGGSYTANAAITLYAIWKIITYTVSYKANGGSNAPSAQTKTYGVNLTLTSSIPSRSGYNFKGWSTSASSSTVSYSAGGVYMANTAVTLYAVWEQAYKKPTISGFTAARCNENGVKTSDGTGALISFSWSRFDTTTDLTYSVEWSISGQGLWTTLDLLDPRLATGGGTVYFGTVKDQGLLKSDFSIDNTYDIRLTLDDGRETVSKTVSLPGISYLIDLLSTGKGVSVGKPAELNDTFDVGYKTRFRNKAVLNNDKGLFGLSTEGYELSMIYVNSNDNTVIGYGGYDYEIGHTNIYGSNINMYTHGGVNISGAAYVGDCRIAYNNVLWSGNQYLNETQTVTLSQSITSQANGVVLVWSKYEDSAAVNANFNTTFIPKWFVTKHPGCGIVSTLFNANMNVAASKYLYITNDTTITGYVDNGATDAVKSSGITTSPRNFVLRYVIGV